MDKYILILIIVIVSIIALLILLELAIFFFISDFSIQTKELPKDIKKVLVIYPHPDDEILTTGGFMKKYSQEVEITWVVLSKGERGTPDASINEDLKEIRAKEAMDVAELLNVKHLYHYDFKDNEMESQRAELEIKIKEIISDTQPDLIISYDQAGLYGHPDHIVTSEIVTKISKEKEIQLWYATLSPKLLDMANLPEHMANDAEYKEKRRYPNMKISIGINNSIVKSQGVSLYKSQRQSFVSSYPVKWIPLPIYNIPMVYEYFYEVE